MIDLEANFSISKTNSTNEEFFFLNHFNLNIIYFELKKQKSCKKIYNQSIVNVRNNFQKKLFQVLLKNITNYSN